jgi:hypothetical protein
METCLVFSYLFAVRRVDREVFTSTFSSVKFNGVKAMVIDDKFGKFCNFIFLVFNAHNRAPLCMAEVKSAESLDSFFHVFPKTAQRT